MFTITDTTPLKIFLGTHLVEELFVNTAENGVLLSISWIENGRRAAKVTQHEWETVVRKVEAKLTDEQWETYARCLADEYNKVLTEEDRYGHGKALRLFLSMPWELRATALQKVV